MSRVRSTRLAWIAVALVAALVSSGCPGGPRHSSSRYCQQTIERLEIAPSRRADVCDSCCHQDIVHRGVLENGVCACYP